MRRVRLVQAGIDIREGTIIGVESGERSGVESALLSLIIRKGVVGYFVDIQRGK